MAYYPRTMGLRILVVVFELLMLSLELQAQSSSSTCNIIVAKDNSGNFTCISEAIKAVPDNNTQGCLIKVKEGLYEEIVTIPTSKINLQLVGDGMDKTIVSGNRSFVGGFGTDSTAILSVFANGFTAIDITFQNTAGPSMGSACALVTDMANQLSFYRCQFLGYQETLFMKDGTHFFRDCVVKGTIDFICGDAAAVFQNSTISVRKPLLPSDINTITAHVSEAWDNTTTNKTAGIVFHKCIIQPDPEFDPSNTTQTYLGRPWGEFATTVVMRSYLDGFIDPEGWSGWIGPLTNVYYAEYDNLGPGANTTERVDWSTLIHSTNNTSAVAVAGNFTVVNFIQGDKWIPKNVPYEPGL